MQARAGWGGLILLALSVAALLLSVSLGTTRIPLPEVWGGMLSGLQGQATAGNDLIIWQLRWPRALFGYLVGAALGLSGAAFQGIFRNPLADPYLMGVASGAGLGATVGLALGVGAAWLPLLALVGALGSVLLSLSLSRRGRTLPPERLILAGVVVGSLCAAATTYLMLQTPDMARQVLTFTLGNLAFASWDTLGRIGPYMGAGAVTLLLLARALNLLQLGDLSARSLGLNTDQLRLLVILAGSLCTAAAVSYAGIIGFVGLITPHLVRRLWGADFRQVLPLSALAGGALLTLADLLARVLIRPAELPVGVVTTLLGGPFFLYLLRRSR